MVICDSEGPNNDIVISVVKQTLWSREGSRVRSFSQLGHAECLKLLGRVLAPNGKFNMELITF